MEIPNLLKWERKEKDALGHPYLIGWSGQVRICTIYQKAEEGRGFLLDPDCFVFKPTSGKNQEELMEKANRIWFEWLQNAGIIPFTEELAKEVINRIEQTSFEEGESEEDKKLRIWVEELYPSIREHRENKEYQEWLWAVKVEADPGVKNARVKLDCIGHSDERVWQKALDDMFAVKGQVLKDLKARDQEPLKAEWRADQDWVERLRKEGRV